MSTSMDAVFGSGLATRGRGAAPAATFQEPGAKGEAKAKVSAEVAPIGATSDEDALRPEEVQLLNDCETRIRTFGKAAVDAGEAFLTIKRDRLHRHYGLAWSAYCMQRWSVSGTQADRLIRAAPVMRDLAIAHESTARELVGAYERWGRDATVAIWSGARDGAGGKATAKIARIAVQGVAERTDGAKKPPAASKLQSMARGAVQEADQATAKPARPTPAPVKRPDDDVIDAEIIEDDDDDAPAWLMPEDAVRYFSDLFAERAKARGSSAEEEMWAAFKMLRQHYKQAATAAST